MNTTKTLRVRFFALAAAGLALVGTAVHATAATDTRPVMPLNGWNEKMGPGLSSVKTPFGVLEVARPLSGQSNDTLYFHTSTGQPVQQVPDRPLGPGLWSVKSPGSDRY